MGLMSKMADIGNDMTRKDAEFTVSQMTKPDGRLHVAIVGVKSGLSLGAHNTAIDMQATMYLEAVVSAMQDAGMDVLGVSSAKSDVKDLSFLVTYR